MRGRQGEERRRWRSRLGNRMWLIGPGLLYTILRLPSFLEPHWYTDEAGYVTTARSLLQGKVLYSQIWTNKPPIDIWTVAVVTRLFGDSEAALHVVTFLSGLITLGAIAYAGTRILGRRRTAVALLIAAALLGSPLFDAELFVPESLLIAPITWAGAILVTRVRSQDRARWPLWPAAVGALAALAVGYQQTALAETCAFGLVLSMVGAAGSSRLRRLITYVTTVAGITALWLIPVLVLAGPGTVAYALIGFYIHYTNSHYTGGGGTIALDLILPIAALALIVASVWFRRREEDATVAFWVWAAAALLVPTVARQPFAHFIIPSIAPGSLAVSSLGLGWRRLRPFSHRNQGDGQHPGVRVQRTAALGLMTATGLAMVGASSAGTDWWPIRAPDDHSMVDYYGGAISAMSRQSSLSAYQDPFDYRVPEDAEVSAWISANGLDGSSAVVWSADAWLYDTNDLQLVLPTPPIYNDNLLLGSDLAPVVAQLTPELVITEGAARSEYPSINSVLAGSYQEMDHSDDGNEIVWLRDDLVASLPGPPG